MKYNAPYGAPGADDPYINGNPATGQMGSIPPAASIEYPQREIVNLITDAGRATPDNADLRQLGKAVQSGQLNYEADTGTGNAYACNLSPNPGAYFAGLYVVLKIANTNTGASVLNLNSLGNKNIVRADGTALVGDDLVAGRLACLTYDGTNFVLVWSQRVGGGAGEPIYLTAPRILYVNTTTGNDSYDGFTPTYSTGIHGPVKTIGKAAAITSRYNLNGYSVTVMVADGTYNEAVSLPPVNGAGAISYVGNVTTPANCVVNGGGQPCFQSGDRYSFSGFRCTSIGVQGYGVVATGSGGVVYLQDIQWGPCTNSHMLAVTLAFIYCRGTHKIDGNAARHIDAQQQGVIGSGGEICNLSILNAVTFTTFATASNLGTLSVSYNYVTGFGSVTGKKYDVIANSVIATGFSGVNYFPGTVAGTFSYGGEYM
jgi:hypothetical protein